MRFALLLIAGCGRIGFDTRDDASASDTRPTDAAYAGPNRAFVSSTTNDGNFGGVAGMDARCQQLADDAGLGGEFVALVYANSQSPSERLAGESDWVDMIGRPVADVATKFDRDRMWYPITYDEHGTFVDGLAWIAYGGTACNDWQAAPDNVFVGIQYSHGALYRTPPLGGACDVPKRFFCAERGRSVPVVPPNVTAGRIAFISSFWTPGGGLASADAQCNADAAAIPLPGTYRAWLGDSTGGPESRFSPSTEPWRNVAGLMLGPSDVLLDTATSRYLDTFLTTTADGSLSDGRDVWSGVGLHCTDWTSANLAENGATGAPSTSSLALWRASSAGPCSFAARLACLQL